MGAFNLDQKPAAVIDGFTMDLNGGALSKGDQFQVGPTRNGASKG